MHHCYNGQLARIAFIRPQRMDRHLGPLGAASMGVGTRPPSPLKDHPAVTGGWRSSVNTDAAPEPTNTSWRSSDQDSSGDDHRTLSGVDQLSNTFGEQLQMSDRRVANTDFFYPPSPHHPGYRPTHLFANSIRSDYVFNASSRRLGFLSGRGPFGCGKSLSPTTICGTGFTGAVNSGGLWTSSPVIANCRHYIAVPGMDPKSAGTEGVGAGARPTLEDDRSTVGQRWQQSPRSRKKLKIGGNMLTTINELRQWNLTSTGMKCLKQSKSGVEFTIMSYNVLAQCLLEDNIYLYYQCDERALVWNHRSNQLLREFVQADADILCLQEIQSNHFNNFYVPELRKLGYIGTFKKRTGSKLDGCALFYKRDKFVVDSVKTVEFCHPDIGTELARDNIAQLVTLRPRSAGRRIAGGDGGNSSSFDTSGTFIVANTHLLFNPGRGDIRLAQLRILLAELDQAASHPLRPGYRPILLCGDMNSEPHCPLHRFVCTGQLDYEGLISGDVSGQMDGAKRGRFPLSRELVPRVLGISDHCQYVDTLRTRQATLTRQEEKSDAKTEPNSETNRASAKVDSQGDAPEEHSEVEDDDSDAEFATGTMSHRFNLVSAYNHTLERLNGQSEVTTHHCRNSSTVDYIFYSVEQKDSCLRDNKIVHSDVKEGNLTLLGTYGLLGSDELDRFGGLPNEFQPSDHLPLMARFLLRPDSG